MTDADGESPSVTGYVICHAHSAPARPANATQATLSMRLEWRPPHPDAERKEQEDQQAAIREHGYQRHGCEEHLQRDPPGSRHRRARIRPAASTSCGVRIRTVVRGQRWWRSAVEPRAGFTGGSKEPGAFHNDRSSGATSHHVPRLWQSRPGTPLEPGPESRNGLGAPGSGPESAHPT